MHRLMVGLLLKPCPSSGNYPASCYWCDAPLTMEGPIDRHYIGNMRGQHRPGCPWNEVIDWLGYQQYMEGLDGVDAERAAGAGTDQKGKGDD
jgi:hypothetical protein